MSSNSLSVFVLAFRRLLVAGVLLAAFAAPVASAQPAPVASTQQAPAAIEATLKQMLAATENRKLDAFVAQGDASFRTDITPQMFNGYTAQVGPRLRKGYTTSFLSTLRQEGYVVYVWKLEFKDGGDDMLFSLAIKDGKVGGFFLR